MSDKPPIRADAHDVPDEDSGPDTPKTFDDGKAPEDRYLSPGDEPAEGRRDVADGKSQPQDEA